MLTSRCLSRALVLSLTFAPAAMAQPPSTAGSVRPTNDIRQLASKLVTREQVLPIVRDGAGDSPQASVEPKFLLLGSTGGGVTGKARIGWIPHDSVLIDGIISGPLSEGEAQLVSRAGLGNNVSLQVRGQYVWKDTDDSNTARVSATRRLRSSVPTECDDQTEANLDYAICVAAGRAADSLSAARSLRSATPGVASVTREKIRTDILGGVRPQTRSDSEDIPFDEMRAAFSREFSRLLRAGVVETTTSVLVSGSYLTANQRFSFADPTTLAIQRENHVGRSLELGVGLAKARGTEPLLYVGAGYQRGTSFTAQPKSTVCQPFVASSLRCGDVAVGRPTEADVHGISLDGRVWMLSSKLALNGRYIRDLETDTNTFEFPVYFLRDIKNIEDTPAPDASPALTGGVTAGWRVGAQTDFYVYFFVGTVLGLPGLP